MHYDYDEMWDAAYGDMQKYGPAQRHLRRIYLRMLSGIQYESVLDVGCGPGTNLSLLLQGRNVAEVVGIDVSSKAIRMAEKAYSGDFRVLDVQKQHVDKTFDLVFCSLLMEHVPDDEAVLENLRKMTGRSLVIGTMAGNYERYKRAEEVVGHVRNYAPGELEAKLVRVGFTVKTRVNWGFPFYSPLTRLMLNVNPKVSVGKYSTPLKIATTVAYWLYFLNSSQRGDVLVILAQV